MKYLLVAPIIVIAVVISTALYITNSERIVKSAIKWANHKYLSEYNLNIDDVNIAWDNKSLTKKTLQVNGRDICFDYQGKRQCIDFLDTNITFNLLTPLDFHINKLYLVANNLSFKIPNNDTSKTNSDIIVGDTLTLTKSILTQINISDLSISLENITIIPSHGELIKADFILKNTSIVNEFEGFIGLSQGELKLNSPIKLNNSNDPEISLKPDLHMNDITLNFAINLRFLESKFSLDLDLKIFRYDRYLFNEGRCSGRFDYYAEIAIVCRDLILSANLKKKFEFNLISHITMKNSLNFTKNEDFLTLKIDGRAQNASFYEMSLNGNLKLFGSGDGIQYSLDKLDLLININKFNNLVKELSTTPYAVPAPLNNLRGSTFLSLHLDKRLNFYNIPVTGKLNLADNEHIKLTSKIDINVQLANDFSPKKIIGEIIIENAKIHIPNIDPLFGIPTIAGSDRITRNIEFKDPKDNKIEYDLSIRTTNKDSIKIYNQFFKPFLALSMNADATSDKTSFDLKVADGSKIQYLKRELEVKEIELDKKNEKTLIDAKFEYLASGYRIYLNIIGTVDSPKLLLSSFPSLPRDEIISLLLYNRRSNELASFDRASVGSTEDAISNRALGLFSIWAFASTPIDSVLYDPQTKTYSAVVSLPGGTSVSIGTDWDRLNNLSFRKRLNSTWAVVTTFEPTEEDSKETIMLQKEISF